MNPNEEELKTFGIEGKLRSGLITGLFAIMISIIMTEAYYITTLQSVIKTIQAQLYERIITEVKTSMNPTLGRMNHAATRMNQVADTVAAAAQKSSDAADLVDSTIRKQKPHNK